MRNMNSINPLSYGQRLAKSWQLLKDSLRFLAKNKDLLWMPALACVCYLIILGIASVTFYRTFQHAWWIANGNPSVLLKPLSLFALLPLFVCLFIHQVAIASLVHCILTRLDGKAASLKSGIKQALKRWPALLGWTAINFGLSQLIQLIENAHPRMRQFIAVIFTISWSMLTFLVMPAMMQQKLGPIAALKRSGCLLAKNWVRITSISTIIILFVSLVSGLILLCFYLHNALTGMISMHLLYAFAGIYALWFILLASILPLFKTISQCMLYQQLMDEQASAELTADEPQLTHQSC